MLDGVLVVRVSGEAIRFWEDPSPARDPPCGNPGKSLIYSV